MEKLRGTTDVNDEFAEMDMQKELASREPPVKMIDLFRNSYLRKITIIAAVLMVCQQLSGINAVSIVPLNRATSPLSKFYYVGNVLLNVHLSKCR